MGTNRHPGLEKDRSETRRPVAAAPDRLGPAGGSLLCRNSLAGAVGPGGRRSAVGARRPLRMSSCARSDGRCRGLEASRALPPVWRRWVGPCPTWPLGARRRDGDRLRLARRRPHAITPKEASIGSVDATCDRFCCDARAARRRDLRPTPAPRAPPTDRRNGQLPARHATAGKQVMPRGLVVVSWAALGTGSRQRSAAGGSGGCVTPVVCCAAALSRRRGAFRGA